MAISDAGPSDPMSALGQKQTAVGGSTMSALPLNADIGTINEGRFPGPERQTEVTIPKGKLTPEGEVIAAYGAAMVAAFPVRAANKPAHVSHLPDF